MRVTILRFSLGVVATLLAALALWPAVVYSGAYNVAASAPHAGAVRWTLDTALQRSVAQRAGDVRLPEDLPAEVVARGASEYAEYCAHCHGAPGQDPAEWSRGMRPEPPHLAEAATEWSAREIR